jgi:hypothetical protein
MPTIHTTIHTHLRRRAVVMDMARLAQELDLELATHIRSRSRIALLMLLGGNRTSAAVLAASLPVGKLQGEGWVI